MFPADVYTVSDRASDAEAARVAQKENQADAAAVWTKRGCQRRFRHFVRFDATETAPTAISSRTP